MVDCIIVTHHNKPTHWLLKHRVLFQELLQFLGQPSWQEPKLWSTLFSQRSDGASYLQWVGNAVRQWAMSQNQVQFRLWKWSYNSQYQRNDSSAMGSSGLIEIKVLTVYYVWPLITSSQPQGTCFMPGLVKDSHRRYCLPKAHLQLPILLHYRRRRGAVCFLYIH